MSPPKDEAQMLAKTLNLSCLKDAVEANHLQFPALEESMRVAQIFTGELVKADAQGPVLWVIDYILQIKSLEEFLHQ